jgi:uncharacterized protein (TIGR03000 family)
LLGAAVGPAAAQNPYNPMTPGAQPQAPQNQSSLTTSPDRSKPPLQDNLLAPILRRLQLPQPSGEVKIPPADAAVLVVRVPDGRADVLFDGESSWTEGATRWFVTPAIPDGETHKYKLSARWKAGGDDVKREREVEASPGHIVVVDFTRPDAK